MVVNWLYRTVAPWPVKPSLHYKHSIMGNTLIHSFSIRGYWVPFHHLLSQPTLHQQRPDFKRAVFKQYLFNLLQSAITAQLGIPHVSSQAKKESATYGQLWFAHNLRTEITYRKEPTEEEFFWNIWKSCITHNPPGGWNIQAPRQCWVVTIYERSSKAQGCIQCQSSFIDFLISINPTA